MSDFSDFFMENVKSAELEGEVKLKRFKSPIKLKTVSTSEQQDCQKDATVRIKNKGGGYRSELDTLKYLNLMLLAAIIEPNLNSGALQDSWGVKNSYDLLLKMFTPGEIGELRVKMNELNGLSDEEEEDEIEQAKN